MERGSRAGKTSVLFSLLLIVLGAGRARAQDVMTLRPPLGGLADDGEGARSRANDESPRGSSRLVPPLEHRSVLLDLGQLRLPRESAGASLVDEIAPEDEAPGSVVNVYHGVQSILVRRALGYYHMLMSESTRHLWEGTPIGLGDFQDRCGQLGALEGDMGVGGRWWERTWRQSLTPDKGGAPPIARVEDVGREIELVRIGEVALTSAGRIQLGRLSVYLDDDRIYDRVRSPLESLANPRARADARLTRGAGTTPGQTPEATSKEKTLRPLADEERLDVSVGIAEEDAQLELERTLAGSMRARILHHFTGPQHGTTPRGNLWTGEGWNVSLRPTLQLRMPQASCLEGTVAQASAQVDVGLYPDDLREPWAIVTFRVRTQPKTKEVSATLDFEIVRW